MNYPMKMKTEKPLFNYMIRFDGNMDYYLFEDFEEALKKARELSSSNLIIYLYEVLFISSVGDYRGKNTYTIYNGELEYDDCAVGELHIHFYVNVGEWLNPRQDWIDILNKEFREND